VTYKLSKPGQTEFISRSVHAALVYLLTSSLPRRSQHFVGSWKLICLFRQSYPDIIIIIIINEND